MISMYLMPKREVCMLCFVAHAKRHVQLDYACQLAHDVAFASHCCSIMGQDLQQTRVHWASCRLVASKDRNPVRADMGPM